MPAKLFSVTLKKQIIAAVLVLSMMFVFVPQKSDAIVLAIIAANAVAVSAAVAITIAVVETAVILCVVGVICGGGGGGSSAPPANLACEVQNSCGMTATGTVGSDGLCSATPPPDSSCAPVIGSFSFSPTTVWPNQPYNLAWSSTYANSCTASNAWSGTKPPSGSETVTAPTTSGSIRHTLACHSGGTGGTTTRNLDIMVSEPTLNLSLSQSLLRQGGSAVVSWSITPDPRTEPNTSCTLTGVAGSPYNVTSGPTDSVSSGPVNNTRRVTLTCSIYGITYTEEIFINVVATIFES